mmetsp:Transcript_3004/g.10945  ORF Transcript_3004/g.10945 Transcript_3004/m.10945 type:complete len:261 (-) Transcript_3004:216-998(-)
MLHSSTMSTWSSFHLAAFCFPNILLKSSCVRGTTPATLWSVVPLMCVAATPVIAVTATRFGNSSGPYLSRNDSITWLSRKLFPTPALPVKKTLCPANTSCITERCSSLSDAALSCECTAPPATSRPPSPATSESVTTSVPPSRQRLSPAEANDGPAGCVGRSPTLSEVADVRARLAGRATTSSPTPNQCAGSAPRFVSESCLWSCMHMARASGGTGRTCGYYLRPLTRFACLDPFFAFFAFFPPFDACFGFADGFGLGFG